MNKSNFIRDNATLIIGGLLGNVFSFAINFILIRNDPIVANLYVYYNTVSIILAFPSLILLRLFSTYGWNIFLKIQEYITKYLHVFIVITLGILIFTITLVHFLSYEKNIFLSTCTVILSILTIITYALRGLHNYQLNFVRTTISFNIETGGRLLIGYLLGSIFEMNIYGWILGSIFSMILSFMPLLEFKKNINFYEYTGKIFNIKEILLGSIILSLGLELITNLDIALIIANLKTEIERTDYNIIQIFRKIVFHSTIMIMPYVLSMGYKTVQKPKLIFFYTLIVGAFISGIVSFIIYFFRDTFFVLINKNLISIQNQELIIFLITCIQITLGYLISNWLFSQNNIKYNFIPIINTFIMILILVTTNPTLKEFVYSSLTFSFIFFGSNLLISIYHIIKYKNQKDV